MDVKLYTFINLNSPVLLGIYIQTFYLTFTYNTVTRNRTINDGEDQEKPIATVVLP